MKEVIRREQKTKDRLIKQINQMKQIKTNQTTNKHKINQRIDQIPSTK